MIPRLFDVLIKFRWQVVAVTADIEQAFLMIAIAPQDRDVLRFLWFKDRHDADSEILSLRFTRLVFGLHPSPAILGSVISHYLNKYQCQIPGASLLRIHSMLMTYQVGLLLRKPLTCIQLRKG